MSKFLITSALPYVNGVKHLGNLAGSLLPADIHARFRRQTGHEVLFLCATDEHGTPTELAALAEGLPVADYCTRQHAIQADIYRRFGLSFDHFSRTSQAANRHLTQAIFARLDAAGHIEERTIKQAYSPTDRRFLPDRYVVGTCLIAAPVMPGVINARAARACSIRRISSRHARRSQAPPTSNSAKRGICF